jgi:N-acetylglucosamine transport system permease protein
MSQQLFSTAFNKGQFGLACAMGVVLALITLAFSALVFGVNKITGGSKENQQ